jgi:hypothetical protein
MAATAAGVGLTFFQEDPMPSAGTAPVFFELKYCERCGGLWLRPRGGEAIYCPPCSSLMRELPPRSPADDNSPSGVIPSGGAPDNQQARCWPAGGRAGVEGPCVSDSPCALQAPVAEPTLEVLA